MYPNELAELRATVRRFLNDGTTSRTQRELITAVNAHAAHTQGETRLTAAILNRLLAAEPHEHRYATVAVLFHYVRAVEAGEAVLPRGRTLPPQPPQPMVHAATQLAREFPGWSVLLRPARQADTAAA
jgi:hypothetical protein